MFFVTLAMNIFGVGVIRDFAFAMNVGVIVGTYSSIFIASPILIWLNDKYAASQRKQQAPGQPPAARRRRARARRRLIARDEAVRQAAALARELIGASAEFIHRRAVIASACERDRLAGSLDRRVEGGGAGDGDAASGR